MYRIFLATLFTTFILSSNLFSQVNYTPEEKEWIKNNTIKIAMLNNFTPFSFIEDDEHRGFTRDLLDIISKDAGLKFDIQTSKWSPALKNFKEKKVDIICGISYTQKRESFTLFSEPYYEIPTFIFGLKNQDTYKDNSSLIGKTVAVSKDIFYINSLKDMGIKVLEVPSSFEKAKAVITGKADYFLANYTTGIKSINEQSLTSLKVIDEFYDIKKEDLRFGIRNDKPILHSIMNKALTNTPKKVLNQLSSKWVIFNNDNPNEKIKLTDEEKEFINKTSIIKYSTQAWKPIFTVDNGIAKGMISDYLNIIEKRTGLKFQYIKTDSIESLHEKFNAGIINMIPAIDYMDNKSSKIQTNSYVSYPMMIITDDRYKYIEDFSELNNKKVAILNIPPAMAYIKQNYKTMNLVNVSSVPEALLLVENGEVDAFVGHIAPSVFYLNQIDTDKLKISGTTNFEYKHLFRINADKELLRSIINKTIDTISPVEKNQIYSKWVQTNSKEKIVDYSLVYKVGGFFLLVIFFFIYRQYELGKINKKLMNAKEEIESILDSTLEGIIITEGLVIKSVNNEALNLLAYETKDQLIGKKLFDILAQGATKIVEDKVETGDTKPYEIDLKKSDSTLFPALVRGTNINIENKKIRISSIVDISDIKNQEKLFLQQSKMAALGEMIGNIAHQWRQPLSIITTSASGLKLKKDYGILEEKDIADITESILESANDLSKTIDEFDSYLRGEKKQELINLHEIIEANLEIVKEDLTKNNIKLLTLEPTIITFNGFKSELIQAILNILYNARDALIKVDTQKLISIRLFKDKGCACIEIQDTAGGIPKDILNKIYEPYFTTKHQSQGTGLGLYMTYNIIKDMGGDIEVINTTLNYENVEYKGAKFLIKLPIN